MKILLPLFFALLLLASCHCHDEPCQSGGLIIRLKGFNPADMDSVILRRYNPADSFTKILESSLTGPLYDTSNGIPDTSLYTPLPGGSSWEIYFPAVHKTVRISDIRYEQATERICDRMGFDPAPRCVAAVTAYTQDGVYHNQQLSSSSIAAVIIVK